MIRDARVLQADFVPQEVVHRDVKPENVLLWSDGRVVLRLSARTEELGRTRPERVGRFRQNAFVPGRILITIWDPVNGHERDSLP
jgi:serine/threonine protein kinase